MAREPLLQLAGCGVPNPYAVVIARGNDRLPVRCDCHARYDGRAVVIVHTAIDHSSRLHCAWRPERNRDQRQPSACNGGHLSR
jgi:hypothetical protein